MLNNARVHVLISMFLRPCFYFQWLLAFAIHFQWHFFFALQKNRKTWKAWPWGVGACHIMDTSWLYMSQTCLGPKWPFHRVHGRMRNPQVLWVCGDCGNRHTQLRPSAILPIAMGACWLWQSPQSARPSAATVAISNLPKCRGGRVGCGSRHSLRPPILAIATISGS